jgi:putative FmdB family regulatory protein
MPTYVYECAKCGDEFELWQSFADDPLKKHPECGGKVTKVLQPVGIVLKGSGFYKNDSRTGARKGGPKKTEATESGSSDSSSNGDSPKSDSASPGAKSDSGKPSGSGGDQANSGNKSASRGDSGSSGDKRASTPASKST